VVVRVLTIILGCIGVAWGAAAFPIFKRSVGINDVSAHILAEYPYKAQQLADQLPVLDAVENAPFCDPRALRSDAIIRLRIAEISFADGDVAHLDVNLTAAREVIKKALSCGPTDAYLWLSLYWLDVLAEGAKPGDLELLRMSYRQGPNEGWVMVKRNHLALVIFPSLPPDLADAALTEFVELLQPEFVSSAADIFVGPGWPIRDKLLERIKDAPESQRYTFAQRLADRNVDVAVPGIVLPKPVGH
jgi:hypothetical protein